MSFYADLPPPSSGVDPGATGASSGWNVSLKLSAPPQRKTPLQKAPPIPRALTAATRQAPTPPPTTAPSSSPPPIPSGPVPVTVNTAGLKPPPQRPQVSSAKLSAAQIASLADSSSAALSAILATLPGGGTAGATSGDVNLLEDDSILNKYNPIRPNDYEEFRLERERRRKQEEEKKRAEVIEAKMRKKAERDEAAGVSSKSKVDLNVSSGEEAYQRRVAASQQSSSSSSSTNTQSKPKIELAISGEEAFARRAAMSQSAGAPQQSQAFGTTTKKQKTEPSESGSGSELESSQPTKVILLRNMVGRGEVDSDLEGEVAEECTKSGRVLKCTAITLPAARESRDDHAVRIFVTFGDIKSATTAVAAMEGRFFGGRRVSACFVKEDVYARGDLTI